MAHGTTLRKKRKEGNRHAAVSLPLWDGQAAPPRGGPKRKGRQPVGVRKTRKHLELARIARWMRENLPPPGTPEWEALCNGCGECCHDKIWAGKRLLLLKSTCSFLDPETKRCTCYEERFEREPLCMPIGPEIIQMGGLPEDCPYVTGLPGYGGPIPVDKTIDEC